MFGFLGNAQRFAGDALSNAYNGFDNQIGGILPGGTAPTASGLAGEVARDILPGDRKPTGAGIAKKTNSASANLTEGNISGASASLHGGKAGAQAREMVVEEARDKIVSKLGQKALTGPLRKGAGVLAPPLLISDTINDAKDAYSTYLDVRTGQDLDQHMQTAAEKRDPLYSVPEPGTFISPMDGSTPTLEQGNRQGPLRDIKNRMAMVGENFDPSRGEFGITELLYGK